MARFSGQESVAVYVYAGSRTEAPTAQATKTPIEPPKPDWSGIDASLNAQANWLAQQRNRVIQEYRLREGQVRAQVSAMTGGRGFEGMSGRGGLSYSTVDVMGQQMTFLTGFWYANTSMIMDMFIPGAEQQAAQKALSAQATILRSMRETVAANYGFSAGANGRNTPYIPEVYQIQVVEGRTQAFVK